MADLLLDTDRDLDFTNGNLSFVTGPDEFHQNLLTRFKFFKGEWFLDIREGVPWFDLVLGQKPNIEVVYALIREIIEDTEGFVTLHQLEVDYNNATRELNITAEIGVSTSDEFVEISETFIIGERNRSDLT